MSTDMSQVSLAQSSSLFNLFFYHFTFPGFPFILRYNLINVYVHAIPEMFGSDCYFNHMSILAQFTG